MAKWIRVSAALGVMRSGRRLRSLRRPARSSTNSPACAITTRPSKQPPGEDRDVERAPRTAAAARPRSKIGKVGLIGFGAFGRLIAAHLGPLFPIFAYDPQIAPDGREPPKGVTFCDVAGAAAACDVIILAMPVPRLGAAIAAIKPHLRADALVIDVCSVKILPAQIMRDRLPAHVEISARIRCSARKAPRGHQRPENRHLSRARAASPPLAAFCRKVLRLDAILTTPDAA